VYVVADAEALADGVSIDGAAVVDPSLEYSAFTVIV
jgi:hypothetical protein